VACFHRSKGEKYIEAERGGKAGAWRLSGRDVRSRQKKVRIGRSHGRFVFRRGGDTHLASHKSGEKGKESVVRDEKKKDVRLTGQCGRAPIKRHVSYRVHPAPGGAVGGGTGIAWKTKNNNRVIAYKKGVPDPHGEEKKGGDHRKGESIS